MLATAADYAWFADECPELDEGGYCLTLVSGVQPAELARKLCLREARANLDYAGLITDAYDDLGTGELLVGVTGPVESARGGWSLMLEPNGYAGVTPELMRPVSQAGRIVMSHTAAAFALAERLTEVRVTPDLLMTSRYLTGLITV